VRAASQMLVQVMILWATVVGADGGYGVCACRSHPCGFR
jgi:hypothetical protein